MSKILPKEDDEAELLEETLQFAGVHIGPLPDFHRFEAIDIIDQQAVATRFAQHSVALKPAVPLVSRSRSVTYSIHSFGGIVLRTLVDQISGQ